MRKIYKYCLVIILSVLFLIGNKTNAYAASATLTGNSTVRAGDTITLSLNISDNGKYGLEGTLDYNSSQVTFSSISCNVSGWKVEHNGGSVLVYDDALASPLSGNKAVLTIKFKVNNNVAAGTAIKISMKNIVTTDGSAESNLGTATYSVTVAKPLSSNANLSSLSVDGFALNPTFSAGTTSYNIGEVEYSTSSLKVTYKTEDAAAKVSVSGTNLSVGKNTISVVVKAENGATKTYKITVTRKQDPNYVASSNANLGALTVSQGTISPKFSADVTDYVVYLPYESAGSAFSATGSAAHGKAQGVTKGEVAQLVEGVNKLAVTCKAEDGTAKIYNVYVVVMPKFAGTLPTITGVDVNVEPDTEPDEEPSEETESTEPSTEIVDKPTDTPKGEGDSSALTTILVVVIVVLVVLLGVAGYIIYKNKDKIVMK